MKSKLYYSFISIFLTIFLVFPGLTAFGQYAPNHIPGLKLWLRSDSAVVLNGSTVAQWNDCSGNSHNATQSNPALQPQYNPGVLNGYPGIYFDGNSTYLAGDVINGFDTTSASVFIVASGDAATGDVFRGFFAIGNHQFCISWETAMPGLSFSSGSTGVNYTWSTAPANILPTTGFPPKLILVRKQKGIQLEQFINYNLGFFTTGAGFTGSFTNTNFEIGRTSGFWAASHHGNIFEVLVFDKYLPDSLSAKVYLYLSHKYGGSPVSLGPDMLMNDFCPTVLHAGTQFSHYLWNTGDTTESITVNSNGSYHVRVTDIFGGVSSDTVKLTYPVITLHDTLICALDSVTLSTGLPGGFTYQWSSGQTTSTITVSDTGSYWVTVTKNSCSKTSNAIHITKDFFPVQASLGNDTSICSGNSIGLTHPVPLPSNLSYYWSTGDTTSRISLTNSGSYLVTVTNNNGCAARDTIQVTISGIAPSINFLNSSACSGDTVYFTNASSPMGDSWIWDFGDGNTSNLENPGHVFAFGGNYQVKLKVTSGGCSNELTKTIIIPSKPQAHFSLSAACIGNPYSFIDQSTASAGDTIVSYDWDFGDATLHSSLKDPDHIYSSAGNYVVVLNVTTDKGCSNSVSDTFTVVSTSPLPSQFSLNFPHPNAVVSSHIVTFEWNIGANTEKYALEYSSSLLFTNKTRIFPLITNQHQTYVNITGEVFWRVIAYNLCNDSTVSAERSFNIFLPNQVQGLQLWLRSDSAVALSGTNVSQWNDCSGNSHNTLQNDPDSIPAIIPNELNGYPGIHFNGTTSYLKGDVINGFDTTSASVFIVASGEPATGDVFRGFFTIGDHQFCVSWETVLQGLSFSGGGNYTWIGNGNLPASGFLPKILSVKKKKGVKVDQVINNVLYYSTSGASFTGPFTNTFFEIGRSNGQYAGYHKGNIFEVLVYNKYLPDSVSTKVFKYLNDKYAPSVNLGGDIEIPYGLCQTSLDAGPRFSHYYWSTGDTTQIINISQSGDYSVTATNIFDASSTDTIHVNMPSIVLHDTTFCLGDTLNIPANMGAGYSYLWLPDSVTSNNLTVFKPGNYSFTVFDTNNCFRTKSFTVVADSFAVIASLGPDRKICKGDYIELVNGAQQAANYLWSDGSGNSLLTINDALGSNPVYSVTVSSNNGCTAIDTILLKVNGLRPIVAFASDSVCFGNNSHFTNMSSIDPPGHIVDNKWNFGDASFSTVANPDHLYVEDGYFQVTLTVTTDSGCINSLMNTAVVFSKPLVNFLPYQGCSGVPISFTDKTQCFIGTITHWYWKFNDTINSGFDTSTLQNPQYIFDSAGVYNVKVIAASNAGCIDSIEKIVIIKKSPPLDFSISSACAEHNVYFHDIINLQPWETIISYNWQFGDGNSAVISNPYHVFDTAGIYTTVFTVKTSTGCDVSVTKPIDVGGVPQVDFVYGNNCILNSTQFSDNSLITNGSINWWHWNFGGLGSSGNQNPIFIFPDTAVYNVSLTVKTDHNCEDSITYPVEIVAAPIARFSLSPEYGVPPLPVTMVNSSTGATTYLWSFGDTESSNLTSPVHTYENQGIFNVLLSAYNAIGCSDTVSARVYMLPTTVDIAVVNAKLSQDNGRLFVAADLLNEGTRKIDHIDMAVDFGSGNILHEQWLGSLPEGEGLHYDFTASSELPTNGDLNFVCVKATLPDLTEDSMNNNIFCVALKDEFLVPDIYPNPVKDMTNITYILPFEDLVIIDIVNSMGSYIKEIYSGGGKQGYNHLITDVSTLNSGVYTIRISFRDKVLRKKFVKL